MSYITPNSIIKLYEGMPLDSEYNHTVYFPNSKTLTYAEKMANQNTFFHGTIDNITAQTRWNIHTFYPAYYQRVNKGTLRIQANAESLNFVNYMAFQNSSYSNKWFYAFVTSIEYINDNCCEIRYSIDVMQTWYFDYDLSPCYIEREHSKTDVAGDNIIDENLGLGEYISCSPEVTIFDGDDVYFIMWATVNISGTPDPTDGTYPPLSNYSPIDGIYQGAHPFAFSDVGSLAFQGVLNRLSSNGQKDALIAITIVPRAITQYPNGLPNQNCSLTASANNSPIYASISPPNPAGVRVRNNKLKTFPFSYYTLNNGCGEVLALRYEYLKTGVGGSGTFYVESSLAPNAQIFIVPRNYNTMYSSGSNHYSENYKIGLPEYPQCSWTNSLYETWLAQTYNQRNAAYMAIERRTALSSVVDGAKLGTQIGAAIGTSGGSLLGDMTAGKPLYGTGLASTIIDYHNQIEALNAKERDMSIIPAEIAGSYGSSSAIYSSGRMKIVGLSMSIDAQHVKVIDDYFSLFGYAQHSVHIPYIRDGVSSIRQHWNYVKTVGCTVHPATGAFDKIPEGETGVKRGYSSDAEKAIASVYDKGITFWNYLEPSRICDYGDLTNNIR